MKAEETALMQERKTAIGAEISQEIQRAAVADPNLPVTLDMISSTQTYAERAALIRNFVKQDPDRAALVVRSEEHTSELQSLMRISYAVFCLKKKKTTKIIYIQKENINKQYYSTQRNKNKTEKTELHKQRNYTTK